MKKITLASFFGVFLVFTINVNALESFGWEDGSSGYSFESGAESLSGFSRSGVTGAVNSATDTVDYIETYAFSDNWEPSVDPAARVASNSIAFHETSNFEGAYVKLTVDPMPASFWLFGSVILGIGGLALRRKTLPG